MADALQLGVDVIATDFGGNTDFCTDPLAHPAHWRKAPIPQSGYPFADGHNWAEPDLDHEVDLCRQVTTRRLAITDNPEAVDPSRDAGVLANYGTKFSSCK